MDTAREHLEKFLLAVFPREENIVMTGPAANAVGRQQWVCKKSSLIKTAQRLAAMSQQPAYMTLASFSSVPRAAALRYKRTKATDPVSYALLIDVDAKDATVKEVDWVIDKLRPIFPFFDYVVRSGNGLHFYLIADTPLHTPEDNQLVKELRCVMEPLCEALGTPMDRRAGLALLDIVRVPLSWNKKAGCTAQFHSCPKLDAPTRTRKDIVGSIKSLERCLAKVAPSPKLGPDEEPPVVVPKNTFRGGADAVQLKRFPNPRPRRVRPVPVPTSFSQPITVKDLSSACPAFSAMLTASDNGFMGGTKGNREDVLMFMDLAQFTTEQDKRGFCRSVLSRWPNFEEAWFDREYRNLVPAYTSSPWHCEKWGEFGSECKGCPFEGRRDKTTPLGRVKEVMDEKALTKATERVTNPDAAPLVKMLNPDEPLPMPSGSLFYVGADLSLRMSTPKAVPDLVVCKPAVCVVGTRRGEDGGLLGIELRTAAGIERLCPAEGLNEPRIRNPIMSSVAVQVRDQSRLSQYFSEAIPAAPCHRQYDRMGWHSKDRGQIFVGPHWYVEGMESGPCHMGESISNILSDVETIESGGAWSGWAAAASVYRDTVFLPYQFAVLTSFASILYAPLVKESGPVVNLVGTRNAGKTTALQVANSVWLPPSAMTISAIDTNNGRFGALEALRHLPVTFNEISHVNPIDLHELIFAATEGKARRGMSQSQELKARRQWMTTLIMSSNTPLMQMISGVAYNNTAATARSIDVYCPEPQQSRAASIDSAMDEIRLHYGTAGRRFVEHLGAEGLGIVTQEYTSIMQRRRKATPYIDRYVLRHVALIEVCCGVLERCGLNTFFDRDQLLPYLDKFVMRHHQNSEAATQANVVSARQVSHFFGDVVCPADVTKARALFLSDPARARDWMSPGKMIWEGDDGTLYLPRDMVVTYLKRAGVDAPLSAVFQGWRDSGALVDAKDTKHSLPFLGVDGTTVYCAPVNAYKVKE